MYIHDRGDSMGFRYAEELQAEAEPAPSFAWQRLLCAAVLLGLVGLVA
jgi:hypothetical protein